MTTEKHTPKMFIRGDKVYGLCDNCNKETEQGQLTKINKGQKGEFIYCPECMKELYPNYKKIAFYNPNPVMNNIMRDSLARYEKRR